MRAAAAAARAPNSILPRSEACVALSTDEQVAELNSSYRGKPAPTNVLSFPAGPTIPIDENEARFLGDVVLALETLQREAGDLGLPVEHHLQHLVVHGLLHLFGYDHETDEEAQAMESLEVRILAASASPTPTQRRASRMQSSRAHKSHEIMSNAHLPKDPVDRES